MHLLIVITGNAQSYTSYFTGDAMDVVSAAQPGIVLMGGASESDDAMIWFLQRAAGGDVLVIRASGSDGYNEYLFSELGVAVNSVETIVFHNASAADDIYVLQQLENCEALWIAGGDQWDYVSYWKDSPVSEKINFLVNEKKITIGGTSAGCAIQGDAYFSAQNGTVTSFQALNNPYASNMTIGYNDFIHHDALIYTITDSHYDNPDRRGRHVAFLARLVTDYGITAYGIGVDEYTAVCIDENKIAKVFGAYPEYEDFAYFLQVNCKPDNHPEVCIDGEKLEWVQDELAIKVAKIGGTYTGENTFDLNEWQLYAGAGEWEDWWVEDGILKIATDAELPECDEPVNLDLAIEENILIYPNPATDYLIFQNIPPDVKDVRLIGITGEQAMKVTIKEIYKGYLNIKSVPAGLYLLQLMLEDRLVHTVIEKI